MSLMENASRLIGPCDVEAFSGDYLYFLAAGVLIADYIGGCIEVASAGRRYSAAERCLIYFI